MTTGEPGPGPTATNDRVCFVPALRPDLVRRDVEGESIVWSPIVATPVALDPIDTVMLDVMDGEASIADLAFDVHEVVGIPLELATQRVTRIVERFDAAGLLESSDADSTAEDAIARRELFVAMPTPCSENESRLGTVSLVLELGGHRVRIACDSRRGARMLREALGDDVVEDADDAPLAFVLTAPQGLKRRHRLVDRTGFVLSEGRGLESGLHALASHLTALLPPAPGLVRIRTRSVTAGKGAIMCLFPLLYYKAIDEERLARVGLSLVDRLALDLDPATGRVVNPQIPWPGLADLRAGPAHAGTGGTIDVTAVVHAAPMSGWAPPTRTALAAEIAANSTAGSVDDVLDTALLLVGRGAVRSAPFEPEPLIGVLKELADDGH
jgi:hypothetical protein